MKFDVVGIDTPCMDLAVNVQTIPAANAAEPVNNISFQGGGKVATGMVAAARLSARGAIVGSVGDDSYGRFCAEDFERHGIDTAHLIRRKGENTLFDVVISDRDTMGRSILYFRGDHPNHFMTVEELPDEYLNQTAYLYISSVNETTMEAMRRAKKAGARVVIDADSYMKEDERAFGLIDIFIGSEFYYKALFSGKNEKENLQSLKEKGPGTVIFTKGSEGCIGLDEKEGFFKLPACNVDVVDTVGAGDVFHGAYIAGLIQGYGASRAAAFASAVSAIKCTRIGGRAGIPDLKTVLHFMETGEIDYTQIDERVAFYKDAGKVWGSQCIGRK